MLRIRVDSVPPEFVRFRREYTHEGWRNFIDWVIDNGHWNQIIIEEVERDSMFPPQLHYWSAYQWERIKDGSEEMWVQMLIECYMGPSALIHHRLKFGD